MQENQLCTESAAAATITTTTTTTTITKGKTHPTTCHEDTDRLHV